MKNLLYYPGFEVRSEDWLKFAILYLDELHPIIPQEGENYLSDTFSTVYQETDLIEPAVPDEVEGNAATLDAIDLLEKMLRRPQHYANILNERDFPTKWRLPKNQKYTLFRAKFTPVWEDYCVSKGLGIRSDEGVRIARPLGLIYMSFLAHVISEARGEPPITDYDKMDQISILTRKASPSVKKKTAIAKKIINLKLPGNITDIDIKKVIAHRNSPDFKKRLHAFHTELEKHFSEVEEGETNQTFLDSRGSIVSEFSDEIVSLGFGVAAFSLGVWLLLSKPVSTIEYAKQAVAGAALTVGSAISIRNTWKNTKTKRLTRKYLGKLKKID